MNVIALTGNATKDIELKYSQGGTAIGNGTIAVRRDFKDKQSGNYETDFINFTTFGKQAEIMANHIRKGDKFGINGRLQINSYEKDGQRQYFTSVIVNGFDFPDKRRDDAQQNNQQQNFQPQQQQQNQQYQNNVNNDPFSNPGGPIEVSDSDLPF